MYVGIMGSGRVCNDFVQSLKLIPSANVVAVAARSEDSAKKFADNHGIPKFYGGYDALLKDEEVDIIYVGIIHSTRRATVEKCLMANKHTLVEKPFACSYKDAEYLVGLAREKKVFLMEGMWTRFFPAVEQARRLALGDAESDTGTPGVIGEVVSVSSDFNFNASDHEVYPTSIFYNHSVGGGASLFVAPYPAAAALLFFGGAAPDKILAAGQLDEKTGVDLQASMSLSFPPTSTSALSPALDDKNTFENTPKLPG
jgi:dihydrodiol dehydrogenase / D-xylose 1-dehydrogenase (NADP)